MNKAITALFALAVIESALLLALIVHKPAPPKNMDDVRYQFGSTISDKRNPGMWCE